MITALFEAWGRYMDSPRALSETLAKSSAMLRREWVAPSKDGLPPDVRFIKRHSPEHFARLVTTDFLFTNDIVSRHYLSGPQVKYVQCWHGTPLKAIGFDDDRGQYPGARAHARRTARDIAPGGASANRADGAEPDVRSVVAAARAVYVLRLHVRAVLRVPFSGRLRAKRVVVPARAAYSHSISVGSDLPAHTA